MRHVAMPSWKQTGMRTLPAWSMPPLLLTASGMIGKKPPRTTTAVRATSWESASSSSSSSSSSIYLYIYVLMFTL